MNCRRTLIRDVPVRGILGFIQEAFTGCRNSNIMVTIIYHGLPPTALPGRRSGQRDETMLLVELDTCSPCLGPSSAIQGRVDGAKPPGAPNEDVLQLAGSRLAGY